LAFLVDFSGDSLPNVGLAARCAVPSGSADAGRARRQTDPGARIARTVGAIPGLLGFGLRHWSRRRRWLALHPVLRDYNVLRAALGANLLGDFLTLGADNLRRPVSRDDVRELSWVQHHPDGATQVGRLR
jgi:hypothetical protein